MEQSKTKRSLMKLSLVIIVKERQEQEQGLGDSVTHLAHV